MASCGCHPSFAFLFTPVLCSNPLSQGAPGRFLHCTHHCDVETFPCTLQRSADCWWARGSRITWEYGNIVHVSVLMHKSVLPQLHVNIWGRICAQITTVCSPFFQLHWHYHVRLPSPGCGVSNAWLCLLIEHHLADSKAHIFPGSLRNMRSRYVNTFLFFHAYN